MPTFFTLLVLVLVTLCNGVSSATKESHVPGWFLGEGTQYTLSHPGDGNCNLMSFPAAANTKYAALNKNQFKHTLNCGRCAQVTCVDDAQCAGATQRTEIVHIVDQCPECVHGDLDLSPEVFRSITGHTTGDRVPIQWKFVDCPVQGPIQYCLKEGSNPFWVAVQPANFAVGIHSVAVNGQATSMVDSAFYFLRDTHGTAAQTDLSALTITLTSVTGETFEETVSVASGGCVDSKYQFSTARRASSPEDFVNDGEAEPGPKTEAGVGSSGSTIAPTTPAAATTTSSGPGSDLGSGSGSARPRLRRGDPVQQASTRGDSTTHATSPALLVLLVLACACLVVLVVLAVVVKHKRRLQRASMAKHDVSHVSELPKLIVRQKSYEELATPSKRTDIAVL